MTLPKGRLEAFSDGVIAIIITIMVLELKVPTHIDHAAHTAHLTDLAPLLPVFISYILSFIYVGIFWNNHHHMLHATRGVTAPIMWANLHLLFWLSLVPFVTGWMGENDFAPAPTALYGSVMFMAAVSYQILAAAIKASQRTDAVLARALGRDLKGKLSIALFALAIAAAFLSPWISCALYALVAILWIVPDPRITRALATSKSDSHTQ